MTELHSVSTASMQHHITSWRDWVSSLHLLLCDPGKDELLFNPHKSLGPYWCQSRSKGHRGHEVILLDLVWGFNVRNSGRTTSCIVTWLILPGMAKYKGVMLGSSPLAKRQVPSWGLWSFELILTKAMINSRCPSASPIYRTWKHSLGWILSSDKLIQWN